MNEFSNKSYSVAENESRNGLPSLNDVPLSTPNTIAPHLNLIWLRFDFCRNQQLMQQRWRSESCHPESSSAPPQWRQASFRSTVDTAVSSRGEVVPLRHFCPDNKNKWLASRARRKQQLQELYDWFRRTCAMMNAQYEIVTASGCYIRIPGMQVDKLILYHEYVIPIK